VAIERVVRRPPDDFGLWCELAGVAPEVVRERLVCEAEEARHNGNA
jgi:hypothetical protein